MKIIERWKSYMGPKDERIMNESNKIMRVGYTIFLVGCAIALYYGIMIGQVASTTGNPILTPLGERVFPSSNVLLIVYIIAALVPVILFARKGIVFEHSRYAQMDHVPWDLVVAFSIFSAITVSVLTSGMRIIAEIQIVGWDQVAWFGDIVIGLVFAGMSFVFGMIIISATIKATINKRHKLERELE